MNVWNLVRILGLPTLAACGASQPPASHPPPSPPATAPAHADHAGHHGPGHPDHAPTHRFDDADAWSKVFDDPDRDAWQQPAQVVALLDVRAGMTVADIGAGTGYFVPHLSRAVGPTGRVIATDIEDAMVEHIRARAAREQLPNVTAVKATPDSTGLAAGAVDRVLIVDVWHHVGDRTGYARALATALRPGGMVAIVDYTLESERGPGRQHRVTPEAVIAELTAGGLAARVADESLPEQYVVLATRSAK